jgi:hypothetical protein
MTSDPPFLFCACCICPPTHLESYMRVLNCNFSAPRLRRAGLRRSFEPGPGVWPLKSHNHFFSGVKRRRKLSELWWRPFGTDAPIGLNLCASFGEGSKARGRLAGGVHFRLRTLKRPHPRLGLSQPLVVAIGLHRELLRKMLEVFAPRPGLAGLWLRPNTALES